MCIPAPFVQLPMGWWCMSGGPQSTIGEVPKGSFPWAIGNDCQYLLLGTIVISTYIQC